MPMTWTPSLGFIDFAILAGATQLGDMSEPIKQSIQEVIIPSMRANFPVGGRPPWPPLSEETVARKTSEGYSRPSRALVATGLLQTAIRRISLWDISSTDAVMNQPDDAWYGGIQQNGSSTIPPRPFAILQDADEDAIMGIFAEWVGLNVL